MAEWFCKADGGIANGGHSTVPGKRVEGEEKLGTKNVPVDCDANKMRKGAAVFVSYSGRRLVMGIEYPVVLCQVSF